MGFTAIRISAKIRRKSDVRLMVLHNVGGGANVLPITDRTLVGPASSLGAGEFDEQRGKYPQANRQQPDQPDGVFCFRSTGIHRLESLRYKGNQDQNDAEQAAGGSTDHARQPQVKQPAAFVRRGRSGRWNRGGLDNGGRFRRGVHWVHLYENMDERSKRPEVSSPRPVIIIYQKQGNVNYLSPGFHV
jgi:hypothetical protein